MTLINSLGIKRKMIEKDEFDRNKRNIFNYGHTFGHAIESISGYKINHGQAVTMGMDIANYISFRTGLLSGRQFGEMRKILSVNMPDFLIDGSNIDNYMEALQKDKKNISKDLTCILTRGFGRMFKTQVRKDKVLRKMLLDYCKEGKV